MQQALAACCANPGGNNLMQQPTGTIPADGALDTASDRKLRIVPNPFSEPPTVYYTLDRAGRMQLIANSAMRVEEGTRLVADTGHTMTEIQQQVKRVDQLITQISRATIEQEDGVGQVNAAVTLLDQSTQQNAALVEQSAAAAESLRMQADRLSEAVDVFRTSA